MPTTALIVANLTTTAPYAASFAVEVYSDIGLTTLVGSDSCPAVAGGSGGFVQSAALVVHGLTYGTTYYARAGVVAPVTGVTTWSGTDTIVMGTHTAPTGVTYTTTLTATVSGIQVSATPASVPTNLLNYEAVWVTDGSTPAATVAPNWTGNVNGAGALLFFAGASPASVVHIFIRSVNTGGQTQAWTSLGSSTVLTPTSGTVTGVALTMPAEFSVSGSPVSSTGTLAVSKANQSANTAYMGPSSGSPAGPTFRVLTASDIPNIAESQVANLTTDLAAKASIVGVQQESYTYAADSGAANAYVVALSPVPSLVAGLSVVFKVGNSNTGASTLNLNSLGVKSVTKSGTTALAGGDLVAGQIVTAVYDGTQFQLQGVGGSSGGGSSGYFGDAIATAVGGESIITLGSTPSDPNTVKAFLNGVLLDSDQYTISTNVLTMTANRFGVGDRVRATWATANSTPGSVTLSSSSTPVTTFAAYSDSGSLGTMVVPFPAGSSAGDLAVVFLAYSNGSPPSTPSGWTLVDNSNSSGFFWSGQVYSKTLTPADITSGSVTFAATSSLYTAAITTFSGSPTITDHISSRAGTSPITLTTSLSAPTGAIALYFGSQGTISPNGSTGAASWNRGVSKATVNNGGGSGGDSAAIYSETLGSSGTVTAIVTYASPTAAHNYQAIVILSVPSVAEGSFPEIRQSQISGFTPAADTGTANAYAVATPPSFGLVKGAFVSFIAANANTGASTLSVNGGSAIAIKKNSNSIALLSGDITAGQIVDATYDGTVWQITVGAYIAPTGGSLILLEQHTASSSAELDFTSWYSGLYDEYEIHIVGLQASASGSLSMQMSTNGGSTYDTGSNYEWAQKYDLTSAAGGTQGSTSSTSIALRNGSADTSGHYPLHGRLILSNPASTSAYKPVYGNLLASGTGDSGNVEKMVGYYKVTTAVNAFRILPSTGNLASGVVRVYGVAH
jgi:hypothetical protein